MPVQLLTKLKDVHCNETNTIIKFVARAISPKHKFLVVMKEEDEWIDLHELNDHMTLDTSKVVEVQVCIECSRIEQLPAARWLFHSAV